MKKKHWVVLICVVAIVVLAAVPFIINEAYKVNSGYTTLWGAPDMLAFYGAVLGAIGTIALGALALWQNHVFEIENDKAQKIIEHISTRSNEINMINNIVTYEVARLNRLSNLFDEFIKYCNPRIVIDLMVEYHNHTYSYIVAKQKSASLYLLLSIEIKNNKTDDSSDVNKALDSFFDLINQFFDDYSKTRTYNKELFNKLGEAEVELIVQKEAYLSHMRNREKQLLFEELSLKEIRLLYEEKRGN